MAECTRKQLEQLKNEKEQIWRTLREIDLKISSAPQPNGFDSSVFSNPNCAQYELQRMSLIQRINEIEDEIYRLTSND